MSEADLLAEALASIFTKLSVPFTITTDSHIYECEALIIAAGASAMQIGLPSEKALHAPSQWPV